MTSDNTNASAADAGASATTNGWPWMKDAKSRLDNPIELVDDTDKRPAVRDLIDKNQATIDQVKDQLLADDPLYTPSKHDDLWILRFLMSHCGLQKDGLSLMANKKHGVENAVKAAKSTLAFRHDHHLDDHDLRQIQVNAASLQSPEVADKIPFAHAAGKMLSCYDTEDTMLYYIPNPQRGVVGFLQLAGRNNYKMVETLHHEFNPVHTSDKHHHHHHHHHHNTASTEHNHKDGEPQEQPEHKNEYFEAHLMFSEWKFQWLDYLTRTTGRLTKYLSIADCHDVNIKMIHRDSKKQDSQAAKIMEDKYPQLLGAMLVVNAPGWIDLVFTIVKPFLPKRLLEKVNLIKPLKKEKDLHTILEYISKDHLPTRYGGNLEEWPPTASTSLMTKSE